MKRIEWQKLKTRNRNTVVSNASGRTSSDFEFLYQFNGANISQKANDNKTSAKNGNYMSSVVTKDNDFDILPSGYTFTLTNLVSMYKEVLSDYEVMSICKRLNPDVEVPGVLDLIQQISDMLESNATERIVSIEKNDDCFDLSQQPNDICKVIMNGELAGCEFIWEFSPTQSDPITYYNTLTKPMAGCLSLLLRNQSRLVQLLEAKDQEIQDYTLNGAVLSRKSLQTTIFDPKKEALTIPSNFTKACLLEGLESRKYSEALEIFQNIDQTTDDFVAPVPPIAPTNDLEDGNIDVLAANSAKGRSTLHAFTTASVMKGPKPMQPSHKQSKLNSGDVDEASGDFIEKDLNLQHAPVENCSSPQAKRTRASRSKANSSKNILKKL